MATKDFWTLTSLIGQRVISADASLSFTIWLPLQLILINQPTTSKTFHSFKEHELIWICYLFRFGKDIKIVHFIGATKPWQVPYRSSFQTSVASEHVDLWWDILSNQVMPHLSTSMVSNKVCWILGVLTVFSNFSHKTLNISNLLPRILNFTLACRPPFPPCVNNIEKVSQKRNPTTSGGGMCFL